MKKISKSGIEEIINDFFKNIKGKSTKEVKKIKKLAASKNIKLKELKKKFCKHCLTPYSGREKIRINNKIKNIVCERCGKVNRWKMKSIDKS